jgi:prophage tail gpP-like protein
MSIASPSDINAPANASRFPDSEIATLAVRGEVFSDWESIWLQHQWGSSYAYFRFIAAERAPPPANWRLLQFKPSDNCTVWLAGQHALTGLITDRQVYMMLTVIRCN